MKNFLKVFVVIILAFIVCIPMQTIAKASTVTNMEAREDVAVNKTWTVNFNKQLDATTVNITNIKVLSDNNNYIEIKTSLASNNQSVVIEPVKDYEFNKTYTLIVTNQVKSSDGKYLPSEVRMNFTTVNSLSISSVSDITASVVAGGDYTFPTITSVTMSDGSKQTVPVTWLESAVTLSTVGTYTYYGTVKDFNTKVNAIITVNPVTVNKYKIVLDAGHGGDDPGAIGPTGVQESTVNLAITLKVGAILNKNNVDTVYTRTTNDIPYSDNETQNLQYRCDISNAAKPNYFVCIHANAFELPSANGTETYYYGGSVAGEKLAQAVQNEIVKATGRVDRGIKVPNYYVLNNTNAAAILIETLFITNPTEETLLASDSYQNILAKAISTGILKTLGITTIVY